MVTQRCALATQRYALATQRGALLPCIALTTAKTIDFRDMAYCALANYTLALHIALSWLTGSGILLQCTFHLCFVSMRLHAIVLPAYSIGHEACND